MFLQRLVLYSRTDLLDLYADDASVASPCNWELPGETTRMFEILYKLCTALEPFDFGSEEGPLTKYSLIPLYTEARKTQRLLGTAAEYYPYNRFGEMEDPESFLHPYGGNVAEPLSNLGSYMRELRLEDE